MEFNVKINVTNTSIIITNYKMGECLELEEIFKVWDPMTHRFNILGMYYDEANKYLYLPRASVLQEFLSEVYNSDYRTLRDSISI